MQSQNAENKALLEAKDREKSQITVDKPKKELALDDLGWSEEGAKESYYRLLNFKEDWEAPGMEAYDEL